MKNFPGRIDGSHAEHKEFITDSRPGKTVFPQTYAGKRRNYDKKSDSRTMIIKRSVSAFVPLVVQLVVQADSGTDQA